MSSSSSPFSPPPSPPSPSRFRRSITCFYLTLCTWFSSLLPSPMPRYDEESGRRMSFHPLEAVYHSWFDRPPPLVNLDGTPINPVPSPLVAWFRSKLTHASASSKLFVTFLRSKFTRDSSSSKKVSDLRRRGFPIGKSKSKSKRISKFTPDSSSSNHRYYGSVNWDHFTAILAVFLASSMKWETALKIAVLLMGFLVFEELLFGFRRRKPNFFYSAMSAMRALLGINWKFLRNVVLFFWISWVTFRLLYG